MNFLRFLSSGANLLNFSFSNPIIPYQNQIIFQDSVEQKKLTNSMAIATQQLPIQVQHQGMKPKSLEQLLIKQQQQLLNECIKLNLELLGNNNKEATVQESPGIKKRIKKVNRCQHTDKKHYAKGLCNNCYHRFGRSKKPWNCKHDVLYAAGMCQNCYINRYNKMRRDQQKKETGDDVIEDSQMIEEELLLDEEKEKEEKVVSFEQKPRNEKECSENSKKKDN